jgi:predicted GNAT superfamily acetyltransferase
MDEGIEIREVSSLEDVRAVAGLLDRVWGEERLLTPDLLRAVSVHGNPILAALHKGEMVGAQVGFLALDEGRVSLHSYITGVLPGLEHRGVGFRLKLAQRAWCLARGIETVTWTFDPLIARNAYFNLRKLAAVAIRLARDFYGPMEDALNAGERTDRLLTRWEVRTPRVEAAVAGRREPPDASGAFVLLDAEGGLPRRHDGRGERRLLVRVPQDYLALRRQDRQVALAWRDAVADALEEAVEWGYQAFDFLREGAYLLERR